jgi:two-component system response regulator FlrC
VKLLRVLQEREVDRVGGARPVPVDVRIIATSNRDLATMVARGEFRADLYYRLSVFPIFAAAAARAPRRHSGPGRRLTEEIALRLGRPAPMLSAEAMAELVAYEFPGNVRELANVLERVLVRCHGTAFPCKHVSVALGRGRHLRPSVPCQARRRAGAKRGRQFRPAMDKAGQRPCQRASRKLRQHPSVGFPLALAELERMAILEALRRVHGNRTHAARLLGISLRTLRNKLRVLRHTGDLTPMGNFCRPHLAGPRPAPRTWHGNRMRSLQHESL